VGDSEENGGGTLQATFEKGRLVEKFEFGLK
jgi:hypothetical protein